MKQILPEDVKYLSFTEMDEIGRIFSWNDKTLRGISKKYTAETNELLSSGLIEELVQKKLFPVTAVSDYSLESFGLILEHQKITPVTYPFEWSFEMLKAAGQVVLEVNKIANRYGYELKDAHPFNVIFDKHRPMYVDFGSFIKRNGTSWLGYEDFIKSYCYPLKQWKTGEQFLTRANLASSLRGGMPHSSYYNWKSPFYRLFSIDFIDKIADNFYKFKTIQSIPNDQIENKFSGRIGKLILNLKKSKILPFQKTSIEKLSRKLKRIKMRKNQSMWVDYHSQFIDSKGELRTTPRFARILEIVNELKIKSALELAGNQGVFSEMLLHQTTIENIICTDYDSQAIDSLYKRCIEKELDVTPVVLNIRNPISDTWLPLFENRIETPECAIGLALLHHLILTQGLGLQTIFDIFKSYTSKYVFIEFMPLGLWSASSPEVNVPEWYNVDWFKEIFEKNFNLIKQEQLEDNRILFVGIIK
jgi:hypothetical protein